MQKYNRTRRKAEVADRFKSPSTSEEWPAYFLDLLQWAQNGSIQSILPSSKSTCMQIKHHGGHLGVTGSCHELHFKDARSVLIDCGMFQGQDARGRDGMEIDFPLDDVQALILTHVHIDHIGRNPYFAGSWIQ